GQRERSDRTTNYGVGRFLLLRRAGHSGLLLQSGRGRSGEVCRGQGGWNDLALESLFPVRSGCRSRTAHRHRGGDYGVEESAKWICGGVKKTKRQAVIPL